MNINYRVDNQNCSISIRNRLDTSIISKIENLKSDKKILLIYDKNINVKIVDKLIKILKSSGCLVVALKFLGNKKNKNEKSLFNLIDMMIKNKFTKKSVVISMGGGVLGDVSALASSLYYRGLIYLNIPTTMTSIIDSCIGGKTAINYKNIINSIGNYYHPKSVFIYNEIIQDIPEREFISGISEIIKCGLIKKNKILKILKTKKEKVINREYKTIANLCRETLKTKIQFFQFDVYEKNKRLILNLGHTFAHAIEMATEEISKKELFRHGEAVGLGILCEIYFSNPKESKLLSDTSNLLKKYKLPIKIDNGIFNKKKQILLDKIFKYIFLDKKKISRYPRYISIKSAYHPRIKELQDSNLIIQTINRFI